MNRKLLNGLLVLAVAAGGVGTFTSCKDENFQNDVLVGQLINAEHIQAICDISDQQFRQNLINFLNEYLPGAEGIDLSKLDQLYGIYLSILSGNIESEYGEDAAEYVEGLYNWMYKDIFPEEAWFQNIKGNSAWIKAMNQRASSVALNQTINPVFGTINLPIGLKTTMLATYVFEGKGTANGMVFPADAKDHLVGIVTTPENLAALKTIATLNPQDEETLTNGMFTDMSEAEAGNMGNAYVTINPTSVSFVGSTKVQVVNSLGEVVLDGENGDLVISQCDKELNFGVKTRADENTGVYTIQANASEDNYSALKVDLSDKKELAAGVKNALSRHTPSDIAALGDLIYKSMENIMPAYAVKVWWEEDQPVANESGDGYQLNADGSVVTEKVNNSVLSSFDLAATVIHPLSYDIDFGSVTNARLPKISPLSEYLKRISDKLQISFEDLDLSIKNVTIEFNAQIVNKNYETGEEGSFIMFEYRDETTGETAIMYLPYDSTGINANQASLQSFVDAILKAMSLELEGDINYNIVTKLNDMVADINKSMKNFVSQIEDITGLVDKIKNNGILGNAQRLVDLYNDVADKINEFLDCPSAYLQVLMAYKGADGGIHYMSTDPAMGSPISSEGGVALYTTSMTGEVLVPSFKKYVAITAVDGKVPSDLEALNNKAGLNKVYSGRIQEIALDASALSSLSGKTVTLSYVSVDYHGNCSMQNYYMTIQ